MKIPISHSLSILLVTGAVTVGCHDEPTTSVPQGVSPESAAPLKSTAPSNSLAVTVTCVDTGNLYSSQRFDCTATVTGGSGTGYNFIWQGNGSEYYDYAGTGKAWYPCQYVSGSYGYLSATAVAFDSNGSYQGATYNKQPCDPQ